MATEARSTAHCKGAESNPRPPVLTDLQELDDAVREGELLCLLNDALLIQVVLDHKLREVTDNLGGRSDLDDVAKDPVSCGVGSLDLGPLLPETQRESLELQVGVLASGHLVTVDLGGAGLESLALEGRVELTDTLPVETELVDGLGVDACVVLGALQVVHDCAHRRLGGKAGHAVDAGVDDVGASVCAGKLRGDSGAGCVVGVDVDGGVRELGAEGRHQKGGRLGLHQTRHVLDGKRVDAMLDHLLSQSEVVVQVVPAAGVAHVARVAEGALADAAGGLNGVDAELDVVDVVEGVEDAEDVHACALGLLDKLVHHVVGVGSVPDGVGAAEEHLEGHVGDLLAQELEALPWALLEEAQGDVEGGAAPHLQAGCVAHQVGGRPGDLEHVVGAHAGRKQRLVSVAHGGVGEEDPLVAADGLGPGLGALLAVDLGPALGRGRGRAGGDNRGDVYALPAGTGVLGAVDDLRGGGGGHSWSGIVCGGGSCSCRPWSPQRQRTRRQPNLVSKVHEELVAAQRGVGLELKELRVALDERGVGGAGDELVVAEDVEEEGDVGAGPADKELLEAALELRPGPR